MKDIQMFPGYQITEDGRVYSSYKKRFIKGSVNSCGYKMVFLCGKWRMVAPLVALAYIGERPTNKHEVNHKDHNKLNNNYLNLEWLTHSQNIQASFDGGFRSRFCGRAKGFKLSKHTKQLQSISHYKPITVTELDTGERTRYDSIQHAANHYNVSRDKISKPLQRRVNAWLNASFYYITYA